MKVTLRVVQPKVVPMDLAFVEQEKEVRYSFLSVGWGILSGNEHRKKLS